MKVSDDVDRLLLRSFKMEMVMSKYVEPTLVQFSLWSAYKWYDIIRTYECTRHSGGTFVMGSETAVAVKLAYSEDIECVKLLTS